jgi:YHS domain-containing protein
VSFFALAAGTIQPLWWALRSRFTSAAMIRWWSSSLIQRFSSTFADLFAEQQWGMRSGAKTCKVVKADPTNLVMKKRFLVLFVATLALPLAAQTKTLLNLDKTALAIQGYDPVAIFTIGKPVKGKPEFPARHNGALYYFASKEHRDVFTADATKYDPAFGGYFAYGVSRNKLVEIDLDALKIVDDRLLLHTSTASATISTKTPRAIGQSQRQLACNR